MKGEKLERPTVRRLHAVVSNKGQWLVGQRPRDGLFGGLWEFPGVDIPAGTEPVLHLEQTLGEELNLKFRVRQAVPAFEHHLSHRVLLIRTYICDILAGARIPSRFPKNDNYQRFKWVPLAQLNRMGISSITKKIMAGVSRALSES